MTVENESPEAIEQARRYAQLRDELVEVNPNVAGGEPVIKGTRVPIRGLARQIELGETLKVLLEDYPFIPVEAFKLAPAWARANPRASVPMQTNNPPASQDGR